MAFDVKSVWAGALTASSVRVIADTAPAIDGSLHIADNEAMTGATVIGPVTVTAEGILDFTVTGLEADTRYWYVVETDSTMNTSYQGTFRTHPGEVGEPLSYIFGAAGDAGLTGVGDDSYITDQVSNNPVFDTMTAQSAAEDWAWFSHLGDLHYRNISTNDPALFRTAYDDNHNFNLGFNPDARQGTFLRGQAITYIWDDHDFGANDSDRTSASNPAANQVYREVVPHYPLAGGTTGIYQSWQAGRVLYVATDSRSFRDPNSDPQGPSKTLLGTGQKQWLENLLTTARDTGAEALVWQSSSRWIGGSDTYSSFEHERAELVQMFGDLGWLDRMIFMTADEHALSICSGPYNPYGRFPMFMFASMDSSYGTNSTEIYDVGQNQGRQQYGTMRVADNGHTLSLTGTGYINGAVWKSYSKHVHVGGRVIALDYSLAHISDPFEPEDDDQRTRNAITVKREDGGEYTYALDEGPKSAASPPDGAGEYDDSVTLNVAVDEQLPDQAAWRAHLGTVDEERYPSITVDLRRNPDLAAQLSGLNLGDRIIIENPPEELPPDTIVQIAEGGTTRLSRELWQAEINASPGSPYTVAQLPVPQTLVRGSFETGLDGFEVQGGATIDRVASPGVPPFGGSWSVEVTPDGVSASGGVRSSLTEPGTVIPGEDYTPSAWVYSPAGWSDLRAVIDWYEADGTFINTGLGSATVVPAGQWTLLAQTAITAPANASRLRARARHGGTPTAGDIWYADEVTAREAKATGKSAGPNRPNRWDTSGSQLVNAVGADDTELVVHTLQDGVFDRVPWIMSEGLADAGNLKPTHFPFDLRLGGETVRATVIKPLAYDSFTRTVGAGSWGTSDGGQAWTLVGGTDSERSVDGSRGLVNLPSAPSTIRFQLLPTAVGDCDIRVRLSVDQVATGASMVPGVLLRYTGTGAYYRARIHFGTSGSMFTSVTRDTTQIGSALALPYTYAALDEFELRVRLVGHRVLIRVWPVGTPEPHIWHNDQEITADTIDAGQVGCTASAFGGNTNVSPNIRFDDYEVITPQRVTVERSINTVEKDQAAGTPLSLAQPAPLAL